MTKVTQMAGTMLTVFALAGCASPQPQSTPQRQLQPVFVWDKTGAREVDMRRDAAQCENEAHMVAAASRLSPESAFKNCMIGRGWTLKDVEYK